MSKEMEMEMGEVETVFKTKLQPANDHSYLLCTNTLNDDMRVLRRHYPTTATTTVWEVRDKVFSSNVYGDGSEVLATVQAVLSEVRPGCVELLLRFLSRVYLVDLEFYPNCVPELFVWWDRPANGGWVVDLSGKQFHISEEGRVGRVRVKGGVATPLPNQQPTERDLCELRNGILLYPHPDDDFGIWLSRASLKLVAATQGVPCPEPQPHTPSTCTHPTQNAEDKSMEKTDSRPGQPSKIKGALNAMSSDAQDAAWRTASTQLVKLVRDPLVEVISRGLGSENDDTVRKKIADFLATDAGKAVVQSLLAVALTSGVLATGANNPQIERLARELRVGAMALTGDLVADMVMGPLRQVLAVYIQGLPTVPEPSEPPQLLPPSPTTWEEQTREAAPEKTSG